MTTVFLYKISKRNQYMLSLALILSVSAICYFLPAFVGYRVVALLLLVTVSFLAMFFDILPVFLAAIVSSLTWNFLFIPPKFTFHIESMEDTLMFLMYFIIAMVNAALTFKIRQYEKEASKKEEKENTLKLYNTLLNSLSHELRTPIATIIGATDNLQQENKLSEQHKAELVSEISKASLRLNRQVENLLNMSRLESGTLQLKKDWCDLNDLIYTTIHQLGEMTAEHSITVEAEHNMPLFRLDHGLLEQVVYNLLYNAVTYVPQGGSVWVRAKCTEDTLVLVVEDNGNGFPEEHMDKAFGKFYNNGNSRGGTGLGLSIVKGFVEAHHGTITLANKSGGGASFTIRIPTETTYLNNLKNE